jgi:hypothetical protein
MPKIKPTAIKTKMIAPCGMNCAICHGFMREKKKCKGCLHDFKDKPKYCRTCSIKECKKLNLKSSTDRYCYNCDNLPCKRLKSLDNRYKTKYGMSMIENLEHIKKVGIREFVKSERNRWTCSNCGNLLCVHKKECLHCGKERKIQAY